MRGMMGYAVNTVSCLYIVVFIVIFSLPYSLPVHAGSMNYTSLITGGLSLFVAAWGFVRRREYVGPKGVLLEKMAVAR